MSSARTSESGERLARAVSLRPTASIARTISWSFTWRKLLRVVFGDVMVVSLLICAFVWHCTAALPAAAADGITENVLGTPIVGPSHCVFTGNGADIAAWKFTIHGCQRGQYATLMEPSGLLFGRPPARLPGLFVGSWTSSFFSDTRRVRRTLQPLNDLAVAAEAIGHVTASTDPMSAKASTDKMATLEEAIERATVDSPTVSTGDKDLRSIEVALNGLLRQMQEAKLQQMRFVSDASHELRTPIAVIQGYVNMLDRWGKTDESVLEESIEALKAESDHMQELVEQLLFLARGDSGRQQLNPEPMDLAALMTEVLEEYRMIDEGHEWRQGAMASAPVMADPALIKQAARVLVDNAARYTPEGGSIRLSAGSEGDECWLEVQDGGIGIDAEDVPRIFDRFFRADPARARQSGGGGTGLGLSIARWIVERHDGHFEVLSRPGLGTRIRVALPRRAEQSVDAKAAV